MSATRAADAADFRGPLDISRAATVVLDGRDTVVGWSAAATALLGYSPREAGTITDGAPPTTCR
ncbi:hypothetical protein I3W98_13830 [Streptomyces cavourensis]|nr:hypothetical protein [Streptomyces cavourensis]